MRKRIANNARLAKQERANVTLATLPTLPAATHSYHPALGAYQFAYNPTPPGLTNQAQLASLTADAIELRRQAQQSARDKRNNRRRQPSS
jgi:hypothetical protein